MSQRVRLATQLFSHTVGTAIKELLPGRQVQAEAISTANAWFDVMNSRTKYDQTIERCAYGANAAVKAAQDRALRDMEALISSLRKATPKRPNGVKNMLQFQRGILRGTASLRGLYADVQSTTPEVQFIMTSRLNQDAVENCFSQLRNLGGSNNTPNAVEVRSRLRVMLMAPNPTAAAGAASRGRAVLQLDPDNDFVSTGSAAPAPSHLPNQALENLLIQVRTKLLK